MRGRSLQGLPLAAPSLALIVACSSSSSPSTVTTRDAALDSHHTAVLDAGHDVAPVDGAAPDGSPIGHDAHVVPYDAARRDTSVYSPFDAFVYPEAAIPHDTGSDAPISPCANLPDESSYCAAADGGGASTGFYVCMQGNGIYSPCSPGTTCVPTDAGAMGIACVN